MTDSESNIQAYKTMAEVLISFRKILLRGLRKVAGDTWYLDACPPGVYERLVERKENELAIERLPSDYQDLMSFATFDDLAEIIDYNDDLARLLHNLAPSKEVLCARFTELEALRAKLAMARGLNEDELSLLTSYSSHLRQTLAGARRRVHGDAGEDGEAPAVSQPTPAVRAESMVKAAAANVPAVEPYRPPEMAESEAEEPAAVEPEIEALTEAVDAEERVETVEGGDRPAETAAAAGDARTVGEEPDGEQLTDEADELLTEATEEEVEPLPAASLITLDPDVLIADMEGALADGDSVEVLRVLRREIIAVAEAVYRSDDLIETRGWDLVRGKGWFDEQHGELGLEPVAEFYELVEGFEAAREQGSSDTDLRDFLSARNFSRLLLTLREVFLRNGV